MSLARVVSLALLFVAGCGPKTSPAGGGGDLAAAPSQDGGGDLAAAPRDLATVADLGSVGPDATYPALDFAGESTDLAGTDIIPPNWAILTWTAPTTDTDGNPLPPGDIAGYYVYHGLVDPITASNSTQIDVGNVTSYIFTDLPPGVNYFAVVAYTTGGTQSTFSNVGSKTVP